MNFKGKGYGKIILMGEHAVVYGTHAIGTSLSKYVEVSLNKVSGRVKDETNSLLDESAIRALTEAASYAGLKLDEWNIKIKSNIPQKQGLGSSAAFSIASAKAIIKASGDRCSGKKVAEISGIMEKVFHGSPSGIDTILASGKGAILFKRGEDPRLINIPEDITILILLSGTSPETKTMVEKVRSIFDAEPEKTKRLFDRIEKLVTEAVDAIENGKIKVLGERMNENHEILCQLGVSTENLDAIRNKALKAGALGAKLTGGGGGGAIICLAHNQEHAREISRVLNMDKNSIINIIKRKVIK